MNIYRVAFIGHREIAEKYRLEESLYKNLKEMLYEKAVVELLVGCDGDFDVLAPSVQKCSKGGSVIPIVACADSTLSHERRFIL